MLAQIRKRLLSPGSLRKELMRGAVGSLGIKVLFTGAAFANAVLLAKLLSPSGYGIYAFVIALMTVMSIPAQFGVPTLVTREVAACNARGDWGLMRGLVLRAHQMIGVFCVGLLLVALVIMWLFHERFGPEKVATFMWALVLVPLVSLGALRGAMLKGLRKVLQSQLPEQTLKPGLFLIMLSVVYWGGLNYQIRPSDAMALQVIASATAFGVGVWLFLRYRPPGMITTAPRYQTRLWLGSVVPLGLSGVLQLINGQSDILLLGILRSDAEVGIYRVAVQMATLLVFSQQAVNAVMAPHFAHTHALGDRKRLQKLVSASSQGILALTVPVLLALVLFGEQIIELFFGEAYTGAHVPLLILCAGQFINASFGTVGLLLNMTGHERETTKGIAIAACVNIVSNLTLIPLLGMNGAALATTLTLITWNLILWKKVRKHLGIEPSAFRIPAFKGDMSK